MLRVIAGGALVIQAPRLPFATVFLVFGWMLVLTTAGLAMVPWRWHRRFTEQAIPRIRRHLAIVGGVSLLLGVSILWALSVARPGAE